jgi:hypothetical protein
MGDAFAFAVGCAPVVIFAALIRAGDILNALALARVLIEVFVNGTRALLQTHAEACSDIPICMFRAIWCKLAANAIILCRFTKCLRSCNSNQSASIKPLVWLADRIRLIRPAGR